MPRTTLWRVQLNAPVGATELELLFTEGHRDPLHRAALGAEPAHLAALDEASWGSACSSREASTSIDIAISSLSARRAAAGRSKASSVDTHGRLPRLGEDGRVRDWGEDFGPVLQPAFL